MSLTVLSCCVSYHQLALESIDTFIHSAIRSRTVIRGMQNGAGEYVFRLSVHASVRVCVPSMMCYKLVEFHQICSFADLGDKDELIGY